MDGIEKGLTTLRGIGEVMGENVSQQDAVIDAVDEKVCLPLCPTSDNQRSLVNTKETTLTQDMCLQMTKVTDELKTSNVKLKGLVNQVLSEALEPLFVCAWLAVCCTDLSLCGAFAQMRSSRNFCLDVVLICIILGLALYLFELFKK